MLVFSGCKINLGLYITGKRPDGYHSIDSIFYPVNLRDAIEVVKSEKVQAATCRFLYKGIKLDTGTGENLCEKAFALLNQEFKLPGTEIYLQKNIPTGAGLGGGSSNAAATLVALNNCYGLGLSTEALIERAMKLGSDCGFFIRNTPCYVTGRGEIMEPVSFSLNGYNIVIIHPGIHISTASAYAGVTPAACKTTSKKTVLNEKIENWKNLLENQFEKSLGPHAGRIQQLKDRLYSYGALYASMSGSGSSVYGIFKTVPDVLLNGAETELGNRIFTVALT